MLSCSFCLISPSFCGFVMIQTNPYKMNFEKLEPSQFLSYSSKIENETVGKAHILYYGDFCAESL